MNNRPDRGAHAITRLRLATGLVLFTFVLTHFMNHALGLVSLGAMEQGRILFIALWRSLPGTLLLYGSLLTHLLLAFWSLYRRRSLRMPLWEAAQLLLGLSIPPLLLAHMVGTRGSFMVAGTDVSYPFVLYLLWVADPANGIRQTALFLAAWVHGCIGLHFWLRIKPYYARYVTAAYTAAILIPTLAFLGFAVASVDVVQMARDAGWLESLKMQVHPPAAEGAALLGSVRDGLWAAFLGLLAATFLARLLRDRLMQRGTLAVSYPGGLRVSIQPGTSILEASRIGDIPHASVCGGRGRCSTCRTRIVRGLGRLPPPNEQEASVLARIGAPPNVRLACQTRPAGDISVVPLLPPINALRESRRQRDFLQGHEREVAVLFADLRGFTQMAEDRLPYDVVFVLNRYFEAMGSAIERASGRIDKFIGDGVMAVFGIRRPIDDACRRALIAARVMAENLEVLNEALAEEGMQPLRIAIGIHAGSAIVGEMGYSRVTSLTAVGDTVNTASRLETLAKQYGCQLVISEAVVRHAGLTLPERSRRSAKLRGRDGELYVYALGDARDLVLTEHANA